MGLELEGLELEVVREEVEGEGLEVRLLEGKVVRLDITCTEVLEECGNQVTCEVGLMKTGQKTKRKNG